MTPQDLHTLKTIETFYQEIGGLAGYKEKILSLLHGKKGVPKPSSVIYHAPSFIDISQMTKETMSAIEDGIAAVPQMAEMIPLGGAADRLHLVDEITGEELPAAKLQFAGRTLFERLICDIQAREYLYYKRFGKQAITPVAVMTSFEKDNHFHIQRMGEQHNWFHRPKDSFRLFTQPLVPVVDEKGDWIFSAPSQPLLKPGGHGVIWKLARDRGIFSWFETLQRRKILVRQINNPIAGLDHGLLAFTGIGWRRDMKFGFASCPRLLQAAEGVNVVIERKLKDFSTVVLTNIEYCDFAKFGVEDLPLKEGGFYSRFSSNTNILFADLACLKKAVEKCPFPGLLLNLKKGHFMDSNGEKKEVFMGRLESTMQNIADVFVEVKKDGARTKNTFITYNQRHKTISTTKKAFLEGGSFQETPELCFFDLLFSARELLETHCKIALPLQRSFQDLLCKGPEFVFLYHPALGPLYSEIEQKIQGGSFALGSELKLEIAELVLHNLTLNGSLTIQAEQIMGHLDENGILQYSNQVGRCILRNVSFHNQGVDWEVSRPFWKGEFVRKENVEIILKGRSEFIAENVVFEGSHRFVVEEGQSLRVIQKEGKLERFYTENRIGSKTKF